MSVTEEIYKIKYMVEGQQAIDRLKGDIKGLEQSAAGLATAFKQNQVNFSTFTATAQAIAVRISDARKELAMFQAVAAGGNVNRRAMLAYQLGEAFTDMQYGLHGAINNLTFLAQQSGSVGPKVQVALAAAAVGATMLARNMDQVMVAFGAWKPAESGAKGLEERLAAVNNQLSQMKAIVASGAFTDNPIMRALLNPMGVYTQNQFMQAQGEQAVLQEQLKREAGVEAFTAAGQNSDPRVAQAMKDFAGTGQAEKLITLLNNAMAAAGIAMPQDKANDLIARAMSGDRRAFEEIIQSVPELGDQLAAFDPGRQDAKRIQQERVIEGKRQSRELNQQGQEQEIAGKTEITNKAIANLGNLSEKIQLGFRMGASDKDITDRLATLMRDEGADPAMARRRAEEMVKAERQEAGKNFGAAAGRVPLMEERVRMGLLEGQVAGFDSQEIRDRVAGQLASELEAAGLNPNEARFRAFKTVEEQGLRIQEDVARESMFPKMGRVDTVAATDWTRTVQDSMDYAKTQTEYQKKMVDHLADIARRGMGGVMN